MRLTAIMLYDHFNEKGRSYKTDLDKQERLNCDKCIPRIVLKKYKYSSFKYVYLSGDDQDLVNATGYDHSSFNNLLHKFKPIHDTYMCDLETGLIREKSFTPMVCQRGEPVAKYRVVVLA